MNKNFLIRLTVLVILVISLFGCTNQNTQIDVPAQDETKPIDQKPQRIETEEPVIDNSSATAEGVSAVADANNQFALDFYSNLKNKEDGNIFFSPYSISTALAMAYEGARGQTAKEMQSVFHFPEDNDARRQNFAEVYRQLNKKDAKYKLNTANALWVQKDFKLLGDYEDTIQEYYGGNAANVDFVGATEQARQTINTWVEDKTNNKIKNSFPQGTLTPLSRLVLTNAIYFKGTWVKQFDKSYTIDEDFKINSNQVVKVKMMTRIGKDSKFNYAETEDLQILEMAYEGGNLSMLVLLPKDDDLESIEDSLTSENLNKWKSQLAEQRVDVFMPKFTFTAKYTLNENLEEMGMLSAFSESADFSGIDGTKSLFIQIVVHQAFVDVNEEGTEAAAATGIGVGVTSLPPPVPIFRADHPFIFIIHQKDTGNILFMGRVSDPTS